MALCTLCVRLPPSLWLAKAKEDLRTVLKYPQFMLLSRQNGGRLTELAQPLLQIHKQFDVVVNCSDTCNSKFFNQHLGYIGGQEARQRGAEVDVLHAQIQ